MGNIFNSFEKEALKLNINDFIPPENIPEMDELARRLKNGERIESFQTCRKSKDGRILDIWLTATLLKGLKGKPVEIATTERDLGKLQRGAALAPSQD